MEMLKLINLTDDEDYKKSIKDLSDYKSSS